jgi:hypothetical protein
MSRWENLGNIGEGGKIWLGTSGWKIDLPSGKHTKNYGKIHHF